MSARPVPLLIILAGVFLSCATATKQVTSKPARTSRPLAYVSWDSHLVMVKAEDRAFVAQILGVISSEARSDRWSVPLSAEERTLFDVINVDQIPKELISGSISAEPPERGMRCETVQDASVTPECKVINGTDSALITNYRVGECKAGGMLDACTLIRNTAQARFNLYHTPNCTGAPYRIGVVVPGDSCQ